MVHSDRRLMVRAAARIQRQYVLTAESRLPSLPEGGWAECQRLLGLLRLTRRRGWRAAGRAVQERFGRSARRVQEELESLRNLLAEGITELCVPTLRQLYDELVALHDEFEDVEVQLRQNALCVRTGAIVLDDVDLGSFEVRFEWERLRLAAPYRVRAIDPRPAAGDGRTVHPHVRSEVLCEGDGQRPIRKALAEGRLSDLFLIVAQVLGTYNAGSAYVSLDDWQGRECGDCGGTVPEDETRDCERCGERVCPDCLSLCAACSDGCCGDCVSRCDVCGDLCCGRCLVHCPECEGDLCDECRAEHDCASPADDTPEGGGDGLDRGVPALAATDTARAPGVAAGAAAAVLAGGVGGVAGPAGRGSHRDWRVRDRSCG
jgi:hypothetical protein